MSQLRREHGADIDTTSAVRLARTAIRILHQNLLWAFGYNVIAIPFAAGVFYPWTG